MSAGTSFPSSSMNLARCILLKPVRFWSPPATFAIIFAAPVPLRKLIQVRSIPSDSSHELRVALLAVMAEASSSWKPTHVAALFVFTIVCLICPTNSSMSGTRILALPPSSLTIHGPMAGKEEWIASRSVLIVVQTTNYQITLFVQIIDCICVGADP
ncbi:hypothetical protein EJ03DRAFT_138986 [Teratosphaeria nubilosa]|uniref:Uncharacterized protein n=1 Tax=Teratosphaeria nubilosa TaxID=161662 RepID=A0A6G1L5G7_9PEZI|nr:hypothetical protein EJ03DRAFT_138986 [Teratosphaeria nubilosa]